MCVLDVECDSNTLSNDAQQLTTSIGSQWKQSTFLRFKENNRRWHLSVDIFIFTILQRYSEITLCYPRWLENIVNRLRNLARQTDHEIGKIDKAGGILLQTLILIPRY